MLAHNCGGRFSPVSSLTPISKRKSRRWKPHAAGATSRPPTLCARNSPPPAFSSKIQKMACAGEGSNSSGVKLKAARGMLTAFMKSLDEYLRDAEQAHGHLCAGQVLGVRLAMLGLEKLGIDDPRGNKEDRKRLVTFVEIDRCATDAVAVVTGCRLGKRALKFRDWGKVAATFVEVNTGKAIRIAAKESSKALAREMHPEISDKNQQQMLAYREITDDDLFTLQWVKVELPPQEFPGYKGDRVVCETCGEGINFRREVRSEEKVLCRACACTEDRYYEPI